MSDMSKFVDELVKRNLAAILPDVSDMPRANNIQICPLSGQIPPNDLPLLAQLSPRERLVFLSRYRIADSLGHCLTPNEVMRLLRLSSKEYDIILDQARKKLV